MRSIPPIKCICSAANNWLNCAPLNGKPRNNCESGNLIQTWCNIERGGLKNLPPETLCQYFGLANLWQLGRGINSAQMWLSVPLVLSKVSSRYAPLEYHIHVCYPMLRILQK